MMRALLENRFAVTAVILFGIGLANMLLQKNLIKKIVGFNIMDSAVFLLLASRGFVEGRVAPIVAEGMADASLYINPIPSGLVLTGIVVSVSISAFSLALVQRIYHAYGTIELDELVMRVKKEAD
ncbi:MAG: sodium:proton antiporter [Intestinimonas sp.]|jgi:multicomponent Na+:H+ antiporter subunit C|nr:sodium:proton antiporter [Intestinimonas sp.]